MNPLHWKHQARLLSSLINIDDDEDEDDDDDDGLLGQGDLLNSGLCLAESPSVYWGRECSRHLSQHIQIFPYCCLFVVCSGPATDDKHCFDCLLVVSTINLLGPGRTDEI